MTQTNFKDKIENHLKDKNLSSAQLEKLSALQEKHTSHSKQSFSNNWKTVTALLFLSVIGGILFTSNTSDIKQLIGNEVASNHIKLKPLEIKTSNIKDIRKYFKELDFKPVESTSVALNEQSLIGGRYCSIQGITAAQLRFKNNISNDINSLYQTVYDKQKFKSLPDLTSGDKPITVYSKGITVEIWVEKDILFALTKEKK